MPRSLKIFGSILDHSGYGEACRGYIYAMHEKGINLTLSPVKFEANPPPIADAKKKEVLYSLIDKDTFYDTVLIHLTPDLYPRYMEPGKYNIGFAAWETSLVHPKWVEACNVLNELWVPCECNRKAFVDSGVEIPIYVVPHGIDTSMFTGFDGGSFSLPGVSESTYKFYSIFQWTNRKNPEGLIRSYFNAFDANDDVVLIIKSYRTGRPDDSGVIKDLILSIKRDMNIGNYPRILLVSDLMSSDQMKALYLYGDCYVCLHRGEGWGLPLFEAGLAGKPVIGTAWGGNTSFMKEYNSYLVDYMMTFVSGMASFNPWYLGDQEWAEPNIIQAARYMREIFNNKEEAKKKGELLSSYIKENYSWGNVADIIINRLKEIG